MNKKLIALAVITAAAGTAHAQSNVQIYGLIDIGLAKSSVDAGRVFGSAGPNAPTGTSNPSSISDNLRMTEKYSSRIGFRGMEDLGGGLKATFELEQRFRPYDGSQLSSLEFEGASNVGLAGNWGAVRFGRMNNVLNETIRSYDPFAEFGVASHITTSIGYARQSSTARYDSPIFSGFSFSANYALKNQNDGSTNDGTPANANDGYGATVKYNNGPLSLAAGYDKKANTNESYQWSLAGAYTFGPLKASFIYDDATVRAGSNVSVSGMTGEIDQKDWLIGLAYKIGAGTVNASYQHLNWEAGATETTDKRYGLGYTHDLSKRTSVYAEYSHTTGDRVKYTNGVVAGAATNEDSYNAVSVGITHRF